MPTINLEMIKKLLEEFSEKEALTTEEITIIEKEISSLEERISFCHNKLKNLGADKEKLAAMKERYIKGNFSQYIQVTSSEIIEPEDTKTDFEMSQNQIVFNNNQSAVHQDTPKTVAENKTAIDDQPEATFTAPETGIEKTDTNTDSDKPPTDIHINKEGNEPIKSINEALKGLFRK